jgi:cell division GTPase FtsZ
MREISASPLSVIDTPELLSRFSVRNHPAIPASVRDIADKARINAVGIGTMGAEMVQILSRNMPDDITCHEVVFDPMGEGSEEMAALISLVRESDLLFILTGFDDEYCEVAARAVGHSAREAGILTLAIIPADENISQQSIAMLTGDDVPVFSVSERSLSDQLDLTQEKKDALTGYSMRHIVTGITNLICYRSFVCADFVDIETTLRKGLFGRLGVGVASGQAKAHKADKLALERLENQGMSTFDFEDVVVIVQSSEQSNIDDLADVCKVIHDNVVEGTAVFVGLVTNEMLGFTNEIKVSIMAARK